MTHLQRRWRKIEATIEDSSGLVPHTREWLNHWGGEIDRALEGDGDWRLIPLEVIGALLADDGPEVAVAAGDMNQ